MENLPEVEGIPLFKDDPTYVKSVGDLGSYTVKSWLDMNYPNNHLQIAMVQPGPRVIPLNLKLELKTTAGNNAAILVSFKNGHTLPPPGQTSLWSRGPEQVVASPKE